MENGDEIKDESQFFRNTEVYVSCGEDFRDPFLKTKKIIDKRKSVLWTSNGVHFLSQDSPDAAESNDDSKNSPHLSNERLNMTRAKAERLMGKTRQTKRLVVLENGSEHSPTVVVMEVLNQNIKAKLKEEEAERLERGYLADFLEESSNRIKLSGISKCVYNWEGKLVQSISDVPKIDKCIQPFAFDVEHSPVWLSKGEGFDSRGALFFVENLIRFVKSKRKELASKKKKLNKKLDDLQSEEYKVAPIRITEIYENVKLLSGEIDELDNAAENLDSVRANLQSLHADQVNDGYHSLFKHIRQVETSEKIFGGLASKGLKLKVFVNGSDESLDVFFNLREWSTESEKSESQKSQMHQLLSEISSKASKSCAKAVKFTRVFSDSGEELKTVMKLHNNDKIWVSQGENWRGERDITRAVSLSLSALFAINANQSTLAETETEPKEPNRDDEEEIAKFFKQNSYSPTRSFARPANAARSHTFRTFTEPLKVNVLKNYEKPEFWDVLAAEECAAALKENAIEPSPGSVKEDAVEVDSLKAARLLVQHKTDPKLTLLPQLVVGEKLRKAKADSIWFHDFQVWKFSKSGFICNQFFPKICLSIDASVNVQLELFFKSASGQKAPKHGSSAKLNDSAAAAAGGCPHSIVRKGYAVVLSVRSGPNVRDQDQQWSFNKHGNVYSKSLADKQMFLTSGDVLVKELNGLARAPNGALEKYELQILDNNSAYKALNPAEMCIFVLESLDPQLAPSSLMSSQRWAVKQENSRSIGEWRYSVLSTALWHKLALTWPVNDKEELIEKFKWPISGCLIPGAPPLKSFDESSDSARTRLRVLKNGAVDPAAAHTLSRMDVKHLIKEYIHCSKLSYRQFEFNVFLDTCTTTLNLANAARRLFDAEGNEYFDLTAFQQDQLIYVSTGEAWIHPKLVKEEQDRKVLLASLSDDLYKIAYFNRLKNCGGLVVETSNMSLQEGTKLVLGPCCLSGSQIERIKQGESIHHVINVEEKVEQAEEEHRPK